MEESANFSSPGYTTGNVPAIDNRAMHHNDKSVDWRHEARESGTTDSGDNYRAGARPLPVLMAEERRTADTSAKASIAIDGNVCPILWISCRSWMQWPLNNQRES
jgi:hypothetical protein